MLLMKIVRENIPFLSYSNSKLSNDTVTLNVYPVVTVVTIKNIIYPFIIVVT